jgi:hypothetical protein
MIFQMRQALLALCVTCGSAWAGTISLTGAITQSTQDGTGPASNNASLNSIADGQIYSVSFTFAGGISGPGVYNLTGATFVVPAAGASETSFGAVTLTISANGSFDDFSLLGCLSTGSGCGLGNELDANFRIPAASLNLQNVATVGLDPPHPLDLLEDDGVTDIHGSITAYSYSGPTSSIPEPSSAIFLGCVLAALVAANRVGRKTQGKIQR